MELGISEWQALVAPSEGILSISGRANFARLPEPRPVLFSHCRGGLPAVYHIL